MNVFRNIIATEPSVRFVGRWAWITTTCGIAAIVFIILTAILGLPYGYQNVIQTCDQNPCVIYGQLTATNAQDLQNIGISMQAYATFYVILFTIFTLICVSVAGLILWKKPGELLPFFAAMLILGLISIEGSFVFYSALFNDYPALGVANVLLSAISGAGSAYLFLTFPNGKFKRKIIFFVWVAIGVSPWLVGAYLTIFGIQTNNSPDSYSLPVAVPLTLLVLVVSFWKEKDPAQRKIGRYLLYGLLCFAAIMLNVFVSGFLVSIIVAIYRSKTVLTPRERNSIKWLIYAFSVWQILFILVVVVWTQVPLLNEPGTYYFIIYSIFGFFGCTINLTGLLMAVLYANAFDINLVIKRTLVYTTLSLLIITIYLGSVIGLQELVRVLTGQQSGLAIVGATLVAALLFQPLRHSIQGFVDRRFYRRRYDAARTITVLNGSLQNETDLKTLTGQLKAVVNETIQPEVVSVWLKSPQPAHKSNENKA